MKLSMIALIALLFMASPIWISAQDGELTPEQAMGWWDSLSIEERIQEIINLDTLENATLELGVIDLRGFLVDDGVVIQFLNSEGSQGILARVGYLEYEITMPDQMIELDIPKPGVKTGTVIGIAAGALATGILTGILIGIAQ